MNGEKTLQQQPGSRDLLVQKSPISLIKNDVWKDVRLKRIGYMIGAALWLVHLHDRPGFELHIGSYMEFLLH
jgi:hypothetical protein